MYRALSAEASTAYGLSPALVIHDELGQVVGARHELYEALETAAAAQQSPLSIIISTPAPSDGDLLSLLIDDAKTGADPRVKLELYQAADDADPFSEEAIRAANPHFDDFMNKEEVLRQAAEAKRMPSREASYRNLILNQRVAQNSPLIPRGLWDACNGAIDEQVFKENPCYIGLDLSARNDLTALVLAAKDKNGIWHVRPFFFVPLNGLADRSTRDRVPYDVWVQQGWIEALPGSSIEYSEIAARLCQLCTEYNVQKVAFDRWRIDVLVSELSRLDREIPMEPFGQGYKDMSPAVEGIEVELMNQRIRHGGHPVLRWCAANAISIKDPSGNRKLDKSKSSGRIDGLVALVMAIGAASKTVEQGDFDGFLSNPVAA